MATLAFDTCLGALSVACRWQARSGEWLVREEYEERETGHAEGLMPMIDRVLEGAGKTAGDIHRIAVTLGPGTFTGARIGVAAARGFALALTVPVVGMSSLAVMAARADHLLGREAAGKRLAVVVDARRGHFYVQVFGGDGQRTSSAPSLLDAEGSRRAVGVGPAILVGSGAAEIAAQAAPGDGILARLPALQPHARFLALGAQRLAPLTTVEPLYLRPPDAKPQVGKSLPHAE